MADQGEAEARAEAPRTGASPSAEPVSRLRATVIATACVAAVCALGSGIFFTNDPYLTLAPLAAIIAAAGARRMADAGFSAFLGVIGGTALAATVSSAPWASPAVWLPSVLPVAALSAVAAFGVRWVLSALPSLSGLIVATGVALLIGAMLLAGLSGATYAPAGKLSLAQMLAEQPRFTRLSVDEGVYLHYVWRLRQGERYYPAAVATLDEGNRLRGVNVDLSNPLSYRLPTLYWLLARVPAGVPMVLAFLAVGTFALVAAFAMARRFLSAPLAFVAAAAVAAQVAGYSGQLRIMGTEVWAGLLGMSAVALFVVAVDDPRRPRRGLLWTSLAVALAAALVRELAVAFLLLGLIALLAEKDLRLPRVWIPWAAATAIAFAAFAAHWVLASAAIRQAGVVASGVGASWLRPFGTPLLGGWYLAAGVVGWKMPAMAVLFLLGIAGALSLRTSVAGRVMLAGTVVGGSALLLFLGPSGVLDVHGLAPAYWASLIAPTVASAAALVLTRLPGSWRSLVSPAGS